MARRAKGAGGEVQVAKAPDAKHEVNATRGQALLSVAVEDVQSLDASGIVALQAVLQHGTEFGRWLTPKRWSPLTQPSILNVDLRARILSFLPSAQQQLVRKDVETCAVMCGASGVGSDSTSKSSFRSPIQRVVDDGVLSLTQLLVICRMGPVGIGKKAKGRSLDPSTLSRMAYNHLPLLVAIGMSKRLAALVDGSDLGQGFFRHIARDDVTRGSEGERRRLGCQIARLSVLEERGCWSDVPRQFEPLAEVTSVAGEAGKPQTPAHVDPHLPLPDDYVAEMGRNSLWLIQEMGPTLLALVRAVRLIWLNSEDPSVGAQRIAQRRDEAVRKLLGSHRWRGSNGLEIEAPPFELRQTRTGKNSRAKLMAGCAPVPVVSPSNRSWLPVSFAGVVFLCKLLQSAHMFVVGLSMGARKSEIVTLERTCLVRSPTGMPYANGRTWKLVDKHDGESRDWVLPNLAMQAVEQQVKLVTLLDDVGPLAPRRYPEPDLVGHQTHLWAELGGGQSNRSNPLRYTQPTLLAFAKALGMDPEPGGQSLRLHRLRKTIARLAALALTQAPKLLKDVFGHKSIEMTLYYILTDEDLQVEIERVSRELRIMRAKETVEAMVAAEDTEGVQFAGFGGPAAYAVGKAIEVHRVRVHRRGKDWGAESAVELADILTLQGKAWHLVRPGIVCTKFPGTESGPCNNSRGAPEPARCQTYCKHRLEEAFLRDDVDGAIGEALSAYKDAGERGEDLVQALWADQVRLNLGRFADLRDKWLRDPLVRSLAERSTDDELEVSV